MKKWFLAFLCMATMLCAGAGAEDMSKFLHEGEPACYVNGQVEIPFSQYEGTLELDDYVAGVGIQKKGASSFERLSGDWYNASYSPVRYAYERETYHFVSEEFAAQSKGGYSVVFSTKPVHVTGFYSNTTVILFDVDCPGYEHSCELVNLSVNQCYREGDELHLFLQGLGIDEYSKVDIGKDVSVTANPATSRSIGLDYLNHSVTDVGGGIYELVIDVMNVSRILSIEADVTGCNPARHAVVDRSVCGLAVAGSPGDAGSSVPTNGSMAGGEGGGDNPIDGERPPELKRSHLGSFMRFLANLIPL